MTRARWLTGALIGGASLIVAGQAFVSYVGERSVVGAVAVLVLMAVTAIGFASLARARRYIARELAALSAEPPSGALLQARRAQLASLRARGVSPDLDLLGDATAAAEAERGYTGRYLVATTVLIGLVGTFGGLMETLARATPLLKGDLSSAAPAGALALMAGPLAGLHVTFGTSVVAILVTLALTLVQGDVTLHHERLLALLQERTRHVLVPELWPAEESAAERTVRALLDLRAFVADSLATSATASAEKIAGVVRVEVQRLIAQSRTDMQAATAAQAAALERVGGVLTEGFRGTTESLARELRETAAASRDAMTAAAAASRQAAAEGSAALEQSSAAAVTALGQAAEMAATAAREAAEAAASSSREAAETAATAARQAADAAVSSSREAAASAGTAARDALVEAATTARDAITAAAAASREAAAHAATSSREALEQAVAGTRAALAETLAACREVMSAAATASREATAETAAVSRETVALAATAARDAFATAATALREETATAIATLGTTTTQALESTAASTAAAVAALGELRGSLGAQLEGASQALATSAAELGAAVGALSPTLAELGPQLAGLTAEIALLAARTENPEQPNAVLDELVRLSEDMERLLAASQTAGSPPEVAVRETGS